MFQLAHGLGRANPVWALEHDLALLSHRFRSADGAVVGNLRQWRIALALGEIRSDNFRNHITGALNDDNVSLSDVFTADLIVVVKGCSRYGHAANVYRLKVSHRIEAAGSPNRDKDSIEAGERLFGGELVSDGPARTPCCRSQARLIRKVVDFDHSPVDAKWQIRASGVDAVDESDDPFNPNLWTRFGEHGETQFVESRHDSGLGLGNLAELAKPKP